MPRITSKEPPKAFPRAWLDELGISPRVARAYERAGVIVIVDNVPAMPQGRL